MVWSTPMRLVIVDDLPAGVDAVLIEADAVRQADEIGRGLYPCFCDL